MNFQEFWGKQIFAVDGFKLTVGVIVLAVLLYWLVFMRRS